MTANGHSRPVSGAKEWTSYERLVTALHHREPDRVPFDLGGSMVTGINVRAQTALRQVLGLPGDPRHARVLAELQKRCCRTIRELINDQAKFR